MFVDQGTEVEPEVWLGKSPKVPPPSVLVTPYCSKTSPRALCAGDQVLGRMGLQIHFTSKPQQIPGVTRTRFLSSRNISLWLTVPTISLHKYLNDVF